LNRTTFTQFDIFSALTDVRGKPKQAKMQG